MFIFYNFSHKKPTKSGLYFVKVYGEIQVAYYDLILESFIFFEEDFICAYLCEFIEDKKIEWARMPRYSKSKLIDFGVIHLLEVKK